MTNSEHKTRVLEFLCRTRLMLPFESATLTRLVGGVSSDLWKVDLPGRTLCVKGALAQLKVAHEWFAPTSRNSVEYEWLKFAGAITPDHVPRVLGYEEGSGMFAMEYLPSEAYPVWKAELLAGRVDPSAAYGVGELLGRLHKASTEDPSVPAAFATDENFDALRIQPYFRVTARAHPDLASRIEELASLTAGTHLAVVHGDVSPKNILLGPHGPVLLDAECGWFGDPAFDLAFCLNHLLLKAIALPDHAGELHRSALQMLDGYSPHIGWERPEDLLGRSASLVPLLALARVDGASPVEYLTAAQREQVRSHARALLARPLTVLDQILEDWMATAGAAKAKEQTR